MRVLYNRGASFSSVPMAPTRYAMPRFSAILLDHAEAPRNSGLMERPDFTGSANLNGRAPYVTVGLGVEGGVVREARFEAFGCGVTIAAASMLTELATGRSIFDCLKITPDEVSTRLGGIPPDKGHSAPLVVEALRDAIEKFEPAVLREFDASFAPLLEKRAESFRLVFQTLLRRRQAGYVIVETGTCRTRDNWSGDGQSTRLFDWFVERAGGNVYSVDCDATAVETARSLVGPRTVVMAENSIPFLWKLKLSQSIDLVYLDSLDLNANEPHPSAVHHLKELAAVIRLLAPGTVALVDDFLGPGVAKGTYIRDFFHDIGASILYEGYQMAWIVP